MARGIVIDAEKMEAKTQAMREEKGFTGNTEKMIVERIVKQAQHNKIHKKTIIVIPPYYAHIPEWQRDTYMEHVNKIVANFDENELGMIQVFVKDGIIKCAEGKHRVVAVAMINEMRRKQGLEEIELECELLDVTEEQARRIFMNQSSNKKIMKPKDYYRASIAQEIPEWIILRDICNANNVSIQCNLNKLKNPIGSLTSISAGIDNIQNSPETFDRILKIVTALQWQPMGDIKLSQFCYKVIRTFRNIYARYQGYEDCVEKILLEKCKGATFYANHVARVYISELNKYMFNIIDEGLLDYITATPTSDKVTKINDVKETKKKKKSKSEDIDTNATNF